MVRESAQYLDSTNLETVWTLLNRSDTSSGYNCENLGITLVVTSKTSIEMDKEWVNMDSLQDDVVDYCGTKEIKLTPPFSQVFF